MNRGNNTLEKRIRYSISCSVYYGRQFCSLINTEAFFVKIKYAINILSHIEDKKREKKVK